MTVTAGTRAPDEAVLGFVVALRAQGIAVSLGESHDFAEALGVLGLGTREAVYRAGRATLLSAPDQLDRYDETFRAYWDGDGRPPIGPAVEATVPPIVEVQVADADPAGAPERDERRDDGSSTRLRARSSTAEVLRHKDFAALDDDELDEIRRLVAGLRVRPATRPGRRYRPSARTARTRIDLERTVRTSRRTGGEVVGLARRARKPRVRRLVVLVDISGSMERYARELVRFAHATVLGRGHTEVFTLGTRLTRITRELLHHDSDRALARASGAVPDWSGGTRLGADLREFNDRWGVRGFARGATVLIVSDGWERDDPQVLGAQAERLRRVAHRIVWVNPLKASPGYEPLAGGMAAALPHVDEFVEGHSLASLEHLASLLAADGG